MTHSRIRALVVDDYEPWHRFVRSTLEKLAEVQVIGEASDGLQAVQQAQQLQPDLIVLDVGLPRLNGIEAARQIRMLSPSSKVLFLAENRSLEIAEEAIRAGASGYVVKSDAGSKLLPAIQAVLNGKQFLSVGLKDRTSADTADPDQREKVTAASPLQSECHEPTPCADDTAFVSGFSRSIEVALDNGNTSVVITTESHSDTLLQKLRADGVDVDAAVERGLLILLDVADSLSTFVADTMTDENQTAGVPCLMAEVATRTRRFISRAPGKA